MNPPPQCLPVGVPAAQAPTTAGLPATPGFTNLAAISTWGSAYEVPTLDVEHNRWKIRSCGTSAGN